MITRNIAYRYGLANGTRGKMIGVVYGPGGIGTLPEALIIEVPAYCGPAFYKSDPKWVPILPCVSFKEGTRIMRRQFPLVAGFALTVNKAQGLTLPEGVVVHLSGSRNFRPASKHGLPFVAFTRSESFALTAFKNLPPFDDFLKGRDSAMLQMREDFVKRLDVMHKRTWAKWNTEDEDTAHEQWKPPQRQPATQQPLRPRCPACEARGW